MPKLPVLGQFLRLCVPPLLIDQISVSPLPADELQPPPPAVSVAPTHVGWHVGEAEQALQTATLSISNLGEGEWSVMLAEDAPWLSVPSSSGTTPMQVTLTADPSYLQTGITLTASLHIDGTIGASTRRVTVPVAFAMGDVLGTDGSDEEIRSFLPVIMRP